MPKALDLTNKKIGRWTVLGKAESRNKKTYWVCKCECGTIKEVPTKALRTEESRSCGCLKEEVNKNKIPINAKNLTGKVFGRLKVIGQADNKNKDRRWTCLCECGSITTVIARDLMSGHTTSCGCLKHHIKHSVNNGVYYKEIYAIWKGMKNRCNNKKDNAYKHYGERGIKICLEWTSFSVFYTWAINNGYKPNLSIERVNVNGNYEPSNCTWIPIENQSKNRRNTVYIEYHGQIKTQAEWSRYFNVTHSAIQYHLKRGTINNAFNKWGGSR